MLAIYNSICTVDKCPILEPEWFVFVCMTPVSTVMKIWILEKVAATQLCRRLVLDFLYQTGFFGSSSTSSFNLVHDRPLFPQ